MNNATRIFLIILCVLMIAIGAASLYFAASSVFAEGMDDISSDTIVNFNQLNTNPVANILADNNDATGSVTLTKDHIYFIKTNGSNTTITNNIDYGFFVVGTTIFTFNNDTTNLNFIIIPRTSHDMLNYTSIIDLSLMFGSAKASTITVEQCENYFTADYYLYNTGTPIPFSVDYMNGYVNGVNDTLNNFKYILNNDTVQVSMQDVNFGNYYGDITKYSNYVRADGIENKYTCCYLPFISPIPQGAHFKVHGQFTHNDGHANIYIVIAYMQDGQLIELARRNVSGGYANAYTYEFDSPANINGFYFYLDDDSGAAITIYNTSVEVLNVDYAAILYSAAENAKAQVEKNYLPRNPGYESIFAAGYQKGQTDGNAALTSMDYIQSAFTSLGEILAIQVFPNVPLGTFFLLPLMASLIFFIVKVSKGG